MKSKLSFPEKILLALHEANEVAVPTERLGRLIFDTDAPPTHWRSSVGGAINWLRKKGWLIQNSVGEGYILTGKIVRKKDKQPCFSGARGAPWLQSKIINCLRGAEGGPVDIDRLGDYVYGNALRPDCWNNHLRVTIHKLRRNGWPIRTQSSRGYSYDPSLVENPFLGKPKFANQDFGPMKPAFWKAPGYVGPKDKIAELMRKSGGSLVTIEELVKCAYAGSPKLPEYPHKAVATHLSVLRKEGFRIRTYHGCGYLFVSDGSEKAAARVA